MTDKEIQELVDTYVTLRSRVKEIETAARALVADLPEGRYAGTLKDLRVSMEPAGWAEYRKKKARRVSIVDKLKGKRTLKRK